MDKIEKDRLDFGFDSIYFRYALAIKELRQYKEKYDYKGRNYDNWESTQLQHFYMALEQLLGAHEEEYYQGKREEKNHIY